jgi:hypothetical protein
MVTAKNKIIYQAEAIKDNPWEVRTGLPIGQPFGLIAAGFFKDAADIEADVPELLECKKVGRVFGAFELVAGRLVDRDRAGTGGRVGLLTGVQGFSA